MSKKIDPQVINERLRALRRLMQEKRIMVYVVPTSDDHISEYVGEHYKCRAYITGFTAICWYGGDHFRGSRCMDRRTLFCAGGCTGGRQ